MSLFLTPQEVVQLTGYRQRTRQCQWLKQNQVHFYQDRLGHPQVPHTSLTQAPAPAEAIQPNLEWLKQRRR